MGTASTDSGLPPSPIPLGVAGVVASFLLLWIANAYLDLSTAELQTLIFLKLLVAGHMTIFVTRVRDWFWRRPWPNPKLFIALETTQVLGTLFAVFGWLIAPIPWWLALGVWGYAIIWMFLLSAVRVMAFRKLRPLMKQKRHDHNSTTRPDHDHRDALNRSYCS